MGSPFKIGFLGAGRMASALAGGFLRAGLTTPDLLIASDVFEPARAAFSKTLNARVTPANLDVVEASAILILAVKPDQIVNLLAEISPALRPSHLIISIAAGVTLARMEAVTPPETRLIRVMPNTPALVGASASGYALNHAATVEDAVLAQQLLGAVGVAFQVKESLLDAVTGLSGSGPAYAYLMIEGLSDGGVAAGLPREVATQLAAQTLLGAAKMVLETGQHPGALKDAVTSPGGTTIEGVHELEKGGLRAALMNAVRAASEKSKRLGQG